MSGNEEQLVLVARLVDEASAKLGAISKSLLATESAARKAHQSGADSANHHRKSIELLHKSFEQIKDVSSELLKPSFSAIGLSAFTLAGAVGAVAEAVKSLGEEGRSLEKVHQRTGMLSNSIREIQGIGQRWGVTFGETNEGLSQFGDLMARTARLAPEALRQWQQMPGAFEMIGSKLVGLKPEDQFKRAMDFVVRMPLIDQRRRLLAMLGLPQDLAYYTKETLNEARKAEEEWTRAHPFAAEMAKKAHENFTAIGRSLQGLKNDLGAAFGGQVLQGVEAINRFLENGDNIKQIGEAFKAMGWTIDTLVVTPLRKAVELMETLIGKGGHSPFPGGTLGGAEEHGKPPSAAIPREHPQRQYTPYLPGFAHKTAFTDGFEGSSSTSRYIEEPMYRAMFQALQDWYRSLTDGSGGGAGGGAGGMMKANFGGSSGAASARFGSKDYPTLGGGAGGAETGTGTGNTRGDRNNNPGNLKFGELAKQFGATSQDDKGFAVFPNRISGEAAQEALISSDKYKGLTLQQFANKYAEGNRDWMSTVGKSLGIGPGDVVNNRDPHLANAIRKAEGTLRNGNSGSYSTNGKEVPPAVLSRAETMLRAGGSSSQLQAFMASNGYPMAGNWCGEFAASVVKASGGTPPGGAAIASNWLKYGEHVDAKDAKPGDIAVRLRSRFGGMVKPGQTGGHVGLVHGMNDDGTFSLTGGNQGRPIARHGIGEYEFRRAKETDGRLLADANRAGGGPAKSQDPNASVSIDFKNMPSWVKSSTDHNGMFKEFKVNRGFQMPLASETN